MEADKVLVFFLGFVSCALAASKCTDISGRWQNELGSRMYLSSAVNSRVRGEYRTAVEASSGAADLASNVTGVFSNRKDGSLLAFSVLFNHGSSLATWVGQCIVCDGREALHTTYILRSYVSDPKQKWKTVIVNQNTFWRSEEEQGQEVDMRFSPNATSPVETPQAHEALILDGKWKSNGNEEIEIFSENGNFTEDDSQISGKWKLDGNEEEIEVYGTSDSLDGKLNPAYLPEEKAGRKCTAITLMAMSDNRIRSWAGHVFEEPSTPSKTLETAWLEHEFNPSCSAPRAGVRFGIANFTRPASEAEHSFKKSETFLEKLRKFFSSMF